MSEFSKAQLISMGLENGNYPGKLYKYRTTCQAKKILGNLSFWFASPESFNDPFDCDLSEIEVPSIDDAKMHFERLGMQKDVVERAIEIYRNKPEDLAELVKEAKEKSIRSKGVLSLSEKYDDILMWSHYGEYHTGLVIGLDLSHDLEFFVSPIKIDYIDSCNVLNYLRDPEESTIRTLKTKSCQWKYEKEMRIYKPKQGLHAIKKDAIKEIYFGIKTNQRDVDDIMRICDEKNISDIKFFKGTKGYGCFKVEFTEL